MSRACRVDHWRQNSSKKHKKTPAAQRSLWFKHDEIKIGRKLQALTGTSET
jgi:hypothetical protein